MTTYCRLSIFSALTSLPSVALLAKEGPTRPALHSAFGEGGSNPVKPSQAQSNPVKPAPPLYPRPSTLGS
jgi:hypothetical protein